jgi:hypothetical protein
MERQHLLNTTTMKRQSIMDTYKELLAVKNWPSAQPSIMPCPMVMEYTEKHGRREGLLYNNRIFFGYINPSQQRKDEYNVNRDWILANFKKESV